VEDHERPKHADVWTLRPIGQRIAHFFETVAWESRPRNDGTWRPAKNGRSNTTPTPTTNTHAANTTFPRYF
jgi:hypothetical protein